MSRYYISAENQLKNDTKRLVPTTESYPFPLLTEEENKRYKELRKIVKSIKNQPVTLHQSNKNEGEIEKFYRTKLNAQQCEAVFKINGAVLVIAGAGSGKTKTIVYRVAYMLEKGIAPESILLLTFTKRAALEMIKGVNELTPLAVARQISAGTFHSFANTQLRKYGKAIGIEPNFTICDQVDSADIVDLVKSSLGLQKRAAPMPKKGKVVDIISRARNHLLSIASVIKSSYPKFVDFIEDIEQIAAGYATYKQQKNILDYDDLLEKFLFLLEKSPVTLEKIQNRYRFTMIDEYQDTNTFQGKIADLIAEKYGNIMVVGDDLQSIYAFRGANFENILRFPQKWKNCTLIKLEQNYRSKSQLLDFTNSIVNNCYAAYDKVLFSKMKGEVKPIVKCAETTEAEAVFVADEIEKLLKSVPPQEIAVLYRSGFHGNFIQAELVKRGIKFVTYGGTKFIEKRHIKDILSYIKIIQNVKDAVAIERVLKLIPGIGAATASKITESIVANGFTAIENYSKMKFYTQLKDLANLIESLGNDKLKLIELFEIIKDFYKPTLKQLEDDYEERIKDFALLEKLISNYSSLEKFLSDFTLEPPTSELDSGEIAVTAQEEQKSVVLSTVHSAKGLEWNSVFVVHLLDGYFPSEKSIEKIDDLEEERRLFYVACSRAKERLFLTFPSSSSLYGGFAFLPSRFIAEIDKKFYDISN